MPTRMIESAGRIECMQHADDEVAAEARRGMFFAEPPLIGRTGQR